MKNNQTKMTRELKALNFRQNQMLFTLPVIKRIDEKPNHSDNAMRLIGMVWSGGISAAPTSHTPPSYLSMPQ